MCGPMDCDGEMRHRPENDFYRYPPLISHRDMIAVTRTKTQYKSRRSYFASIFETNSAPPSEDGDQDSTIDNDDGVDEEEEVHTSVSPLKTVIERPCSLILAEEFVSIPPLGFDVAPPSESAPSTPNEGDKKSIAVSMDFVNAAKKVLVSAAEPKRATMVKRALTGDFEEWGSPAGLVDCAGETIWFVDTESIAEYSATIAA